MLEEVLGSRTKVRILRVLGSAPNREYTIRELASSLRLSFGSVYPAVQQLIGARAVLARRVGRSVGVRANQGHPLFRALASLFSDEASALVTVAQAFADGLPPQGIRSVVLFGSVARGEASARSDIDVLVVVDDPRRAAPIRRAAAGILDRFDANVVPLVLTQREVDDRLRSFDPLLTTIAKEGRRLSGKVPWLER